MKNKIWILCVTLILGVCIMGGRQAQAQTEYPYLIKVNRKQCVVTVYEKDKNGEYTSPVKAMLCSPGWDTPIGTFKTPEKYRWRLLMGDVWGQYSTRINKGVLFHSVWYYEQDPSTLSNKQFNKLGSVCSHGCVRLNVEDAKWIYDNCPTGTTVTIYDSSNPGPLGKPDAIRVSTSSLMGYDPTDIWSKDNPYLVHEPKISGVENQTVEYGVSFNVLKGVTAQSSTETSISSSIKTLIKYQGKKVKSIDTTTAGKYYVTYKVMDALGKKTSADSVITVVDHVKPKIIGAYNIYLNGEEDFDQETVLDGVTAKWHGEELEEGSVEATLKEVKVTDDMQVYKVTYKATAPNGVVGKKIKKVYIDLEAPTLEGIKDKEITMDTVVDREFALENVFVSDNFKTIDPDSIKVAISKENDSEYVVNYWVKDKCRNIAKQTAVYTITNFLSFRGVEDKTISSSTYMGTYQALIDVKAYDKSSDITSSIDVDISELVDGKYTVTYTIKDEAGHEKIATAIFTVE
ncbi:MAG: L,D-transpeptidase family protein [Velocimicrobium sp.]